MPAGVTSTAPSRPSIDPEPPSVAAPHPRQHRMLLRGGRSLREYDPPHAALSPAPERQRQPR
eukprot:CAMPEP_0118934810 /NCGR_PEP_ID=MMETSP1169-20130426/14208_1 /TAXON_ID=36882 /ORGANISM="Pyramimonas obovata, Strain CCMP722" /LENGTH=61 /DNA_ID=CAMNT_0006877747 /DNA_START=122 /DNA_END=303 /DNA_ORIENTATION=-